jgi:hypothetical protein
VGPRNRIGTTLFVSAAGTLTSAGGRNPVGDLATDPQPKPPRAHECGGSIKRKDRDRADSIAEEGPIGFQAERAARIQFALVSISILDYETNSQSTPAANLF